jgi:hypothetical protein
MILSQSLVERKEGLIEAEVDGELVALHVENGKCYGFNGTATKIWQLLDEPKSVGQLCTELTENFAVPIAGFEAEVMEFVRELEADGLVTVNPGTGHEQQGEQR